MLSLHEQHPSDLFGFQSASEVRSFRESLHVWHFGKVSNKSVQRTRKMLTPLSY